MNILQEVENKVFAHQDLTKEDALKLAQLEGSAIMPLLALANKVRQHFVGDKADLCSIINAKSGKCSEDCKFCAQSSYFKTDIEVYGVLDEDQVLARAKELEAQGVHRYSLVTSGRGIDAEDFAKVLAIYKTLKKETTLKLCASHGIITKDQAKQLTEAGVYRYHHNLEACREFYENICTTHTYEDRVETIKACQEVGMEVCCGGIFSLGETIEHRIQMAFEIKELGISQVPLNILNPVAGTGLEKQSIISPLEILKTIAIYRLILPKADIRYAGGREKALKDLQALGFAAGLNGALVGSYLTTSGRAVIDDVTMITDLGFEV